MAIRNIACLSSDDTFLDPAKDDCGSRYMNISTLLYEVVSTVAYGGNALINVRRQHHGLVGLLLS